VNQRSNSHHRSSDSSLAGTGSKILVAAHRRSLRTLLKQLQLVLERYLGSYFERWKPREDRPTAIRCTKYNHAASFAERKRLLQCVSVEL
jgi:hypothetical protein